MLGNYLDPVFRGVHLELVNELQNVKNAIKIEWGSLEGDDEGSAVAEEVPMDDDDSDLTMRLLRERRLRNGIEPRHNSGRATSKIENEMMEYESWPDAPKNVKRLLWWKENQAKFPLLSVAAREVSFTQSPTYTLIRSNINCYCHKI